MKKLLLLGLFVGLAGALAIPAVAKQKSTDLPSSQEAAKKHKRHRHHHHKNPHKGHLDHEMPTA